jgi:hypothetical protein
MKKMVNMNTFALIYLLTTRGINAFSPVRSTPSINSIPQSKLSMAMDEAMIERLNGITRSYDTLTERLGDPDVIADSKLLMKIMSDRSKSEDVVNAFYEVSYYRHYV